MTYGNAKVKSKYKMKESDGKVTDIKHDYEVEKDLGVLFDTKLSFCYVSGLVEKTSCVAAWLSRRMLPPAASHRLCKQLNDKLSACRRCWRFGNGLSNTITLQIPRSLTLVGDDAGCQSHYGGQERPGRGRQQARSSVCLAKLDICNCIV